MILDVDTGSDDAVAIMTAILSPEIELVAVCSVMGNLSVELTTENTLRVVQAMGAKVPVYQGASAPLAKGITPGRIAPSSRIQVEIDGKTVRLHEDTLDMPPATIKPEAIPAAMFYVDYLRRATEPVTVVLVGCLTNFAIALMMDPTIIKNVEEVVIMGGGCKASNVTGAAEGNIFRDPEAALWVLRSGAKVTWVPLDATHAAGLDLHDCAALRGLGSLAGQYAADLIEHRIKVYSRMQPLDIPDSAAVHDALAVCYVIDSTVLRDLEHVHMDIGLSGYGDGQTIVDLRHFPEERNCYFAFSSDRAKFSGMLRDILKGGPRA